MNAEKKTCSVLIPMGEKEHKGAHFCSDDPDFVHLCDTQCPTCEYYCELDHAHEQAMHHTTHGNVRGHIFVSDKKDIDVGTRKYVSGERGDAEMCHLFCRHRGRGHIHLARCEAESPETCVSQGDQRHETRTYGISVPGDLKEDIDGITKDELTHAAHWRKIGFRDPCTEDEQQLFIKCDHCCQHPDHDNEDFDTEGGENFGPSFCVRKYLWSCM
eukprot:TRINITY_DN1436_c0_g2_i7.p2 TRINITY_DN1436_c0_g2~~TRINITY_DN1436_c0_g2_i7.p2  ORF type:complete len:215 (+),score=47.27 TRINITY_DN1436_c0_g2_i7:165-809(+)